MPICQCNECNPNSAEQANARATRLLRACLSPRQLQQYDEHEYFDVVGSAGGHYRVHTTGGVYQGGNVQFRDASGHLRRRYCAHGADWRMPSADHFLLQKLTLEADELHFRAVAYPW